MVHEEGLLWIFHGGPDIALHCYLPLDGHRRPASRVLQYSKKSKKIAVSRKEICKQKSNFANQHHVFLVVETHERRMRLT